MRHIIITRLSESEIGKKIGIKKHKKQIQSTCRRLLAENDLKGHLRLTKKKSDIQFQNALETVVKRRFEKEKKYYLFTAFIKAEN